jgi:hypothetical protein
MARLGRLDDGADALSAGGRCCWRPEGVLPISLAPPAAVLGFYGVA